MKAKIFLILFAIAIGIWGRLIPHWPNFTPIMSLCLLAGAWFSRSVAVLVMGAIIIISDGALSLLFHYPWWGTWSIFVYSGYALPLFLGRYLSHQLKMIPAIGLTIGSALFFWIWTNFGTWLTTSLYPKTAWGFMACYIAALPFLCAAVLGGVLWTFILLCGYKLTERGSLFFANFTTAMFRG